MRTALPHPLRLVAALLLVVACGDDADDVGTNVPGGSDALTDAEARYIGEVIVGQSYDAGTGAVVLSRSSQLSAIGDPGILADDSVRIDTSRTLDCPLGGTMTADVSVLAVLDEATGGIEVDLLATHDHDACAVEAPESGRRFTLEGAPAIVSDYLLQISSGGTATTNGSLGGAVDWTTDGASGTCEIDLAIATTATFGQPGTIAINGTVCGTAVDQTVDFTPSD